MDILARLDALIAQHGLKHWSFAARKDADFLAAVEAATTALPADVPFAARVYAAAHQDSPVCPSGGVRTLNSITAGWRFCGRAASCACARASVSQKSKTNVDHEARLAKTRATLKSRYGDENPGRLPQAIAAHRAHYADMEKRSNSVAKGRQTMLARHGVENALQLNIDRKAIAQRHISEDSRTILNSADEFAAFVADKSSSKAAQLLGIEVTTVNNYIRKYDIVRNLDSSYEDEIAAFLREEQFVFVPRNRAVVPGHQIDFYLPYHKLTIEFNGLYWHSDQNRDNDYHHRKWLACHNAGLRLLMINEDEWLARSDVLKRKIINLCGRSERGVGARKLTIAEITKGEASDFCARNHIQGAPGNCAFAYGAFDQQNLVGVITLNRQRGTQTLDLNRFCSDGKTYAGMFSKMLKRIRAIHDETIVTFADRRYSDGGLYERSGFQMDGVIRPDYRYVKRQQTYHKSVFTKARIAKKFGIDMTGKTEAEAMRELGYSRIYDCGKIRYILPARS